jgi:hypothetical protein
MSLYYGRYRVNLSDEIGYILDQMDLKLKALLRHARIIAVNRAIAIDNYLDEHDAPNTTGKISPW